MYSSSAAEQSLGIVVHVAFLWLHKTQVLLHLFACCDIVSRVCLCDLHPFPASHCLCIRSSLPKLNQQNNMLNMILLLLLLLLWVVEGKSCTEYVVHYVFP